MPFNFGEYPLHITYNAKKKEYTVDAESLPVCETMGVLEKFSEDQKDIMAARALAHGYVLVEPEEEKAS